jgi:hypothetical protein
MRKKPRLLLRIENRTSIKKPELLNPPKIYKRIITYNMMNMKNQHKEDTMGRWEVE